MDHPLILAPLARGRGDRPQTGSISRNSRFNILPEGFFGSAGRKTTCLGRLKGARSAVAPMMSSLVALAPALTTTAAHTRSTHFGSASPTTATSLTAG